MYLGFASAELVYPVELDLGSQRTLAVAEAPSRNADSSAAIVAVGPPSFENKWVRKRPGRRRDGETKMICREG